MPLKWVACISASNELFWADWDVLCWRLPQHTALESLLTCDLDLHHGKVHPRIGALVTSQSHSHRTRNISTNICSMQYSMFCFFVGLHSWFVLTFHSGTRALVHPSYHFVPDRLLCWLLIDFVHGMQWFVSTVVSLCCHNMHALSLMDQWVSFFC